MAESLKTGDGQHGATDRFDSGRFRLFWFFQGWKRRPIGSKDSGMEAEAVIIKNGELEAVDTTSGRNEFTGSAIHRPAL